MGSSSLLRSKGLESTPALGGWPLVPIPEILGHSPISGTCSLMVTAQSLLQKPQAVLSGL